MSKPNLLIIGAGGVGAVTVNKAAQFAAEFGTITLASRSSAKLEKLASEVAARFPGTTIQVETVNARDVTDVERLIKSVDAGLVINVATPYCNKAIVEACLATGTHYMDTAVSEDEHVENMPAPWYEIFEFTKRPSFAEKNLNAVLGIGFDPGVVNVFCAHAAKHLLDEIETIDIIDVNGGDHGRYFATNFDPDTNLREIREDVVYWEEGEYKKIGHHSRMMTVDLPRVGRHTVYSMGHDELHSLPYRFPKAKRIEFWMGFGERYLMVFDVLEKLGLTSSIPVDVEGHQIAPVKMVKAVLPDPASLAAGYTGEVCIGCDIRGTKNGEPRRVFVYSNCDHKACFEEVGSQAISYTTGVPVITAAILLARGVWNPGTLVNVEELDPDPFLSLMPEVGIDWSAVDLALDGSWPYEYG